MYIFVWFALTSVFWTRTASLLITMAYDMSEGGQSVMLSASGLFIDRSRPALRWHITSAWEVWPVGDKRAQSLISDSSLLSDWPSPHQSSALLSAPAVILTILSHTVEMLRSTEFQRAFVLSANPCASHILSASGPNCVFTLMSSSSTVLARCQRQIIPDFPLWGETVSLWLTTA